MKNADGTTKSVAITIKRADDKTAIGGCNTGGVTEDRDFLACGKLTISDADAGRNSFKEGSTRARTAMAAVLGRKLGLHS